MSRVLCLSVMLVLMAVESVHSQEGCPVPSFALPTDASNIMSEQQENDFGDAFAEQIQREFLVIEDEITENIRRIGRRLLEQAPTSSAGPEGAFISPEKWLPPVKMKTSLPE